MDGDDILYGQSRDPQTEIVRLRRLIRARDTAHAEREQDLKQDIETLKTEIEQREQLEQNLHTQLRQAQKELIEERDRLRYQAFAEGGSKEQDLFDWGSFKGGFGDDR